MKPCFVTCSLESFKYIRDELVYNNPVNLSLCTSIRRGKFSWYPDSEGRPSIVFDGCSTEWSYGSIEVRDAEFDRITSNQQQGD